MYLTISSVLTTCLFVSLLSVILILVFKSDTVLRKIGPDCMIIVLLAIVTRMMFPLEFWYTYSVRIEDFLPSLRMVLIFPVLTEPFKITVWHLLCVIWGVGIIYSIVYKIVSYHRLFRYVSIMPQQAWENLRVQYELDELKDLGKVRVIISEEFSGPYLLGFRRPYLILPKFLDDKQQLRYIILHEMMHVYNKDIVWKIIIDLLCTIFWWNPVFSLLKKKLFGLIEIRNDMRVISLLPEDEQIQYMDCLKEMAKYISNKDMSYEVSFSRSDFEELKRRLKLIASKKRFCRWQQIVVKSIVIICLFLSTFFVFEPFRLIDEEEAGGIPLTVDNTYLIQNDEQYDVYIDGEYFFTTDDLSPFQGINIYQNLEEVKENE